MIEKRRGPCIQSTQSPLPEEVDTLSVRQDFDRPLDVEVFAREAGTTVGVGVDAYIVGTTVGVDACVVGKTACVTLATTRMWRWLHKRWGLLSRQSP